LLEGNRGQEELIGKQQTRKPQRADEQIGPHSLGLVSVGGKYRYVSPKPPKAWQGVRKILAALKEGSKASRNGSSEFTRLSEGRELRNPF
jgi:hypothetical protein